MLGEKDLSAKKEAKSFYERNKKELDAYTTFSAADFDFLQTCKTTSASETPEYQFILQKYIVYLHRAVERFERGPKGQKGKLNGSNRLQVLNEEAEDRMMVLATEFTRNTLVSADYDEFNWLHGLFQASLHKMALDAKGRGLDCWILSDSVPDSSDNNSACDGLGLRRRTPQFDK